MTEYPEELDLQKRARSLAAGGFVFKLGRTIGGGQPVDKSSVKG
jgi:hypothetical protein